MSIRSTFDALTFDAVEQMIASGQEEHLRLDFKTVGKDDLSLADDRRNLSIAISGFANSDGGLIIWGVTTKQGPDRIDCASGSRLVLNPALLVTRLNDLTGEATSPIVDGVEHRALTPVAGGAGYVATLVPSSDRVPHMALLREHRYFKRSGSAFYTMEHFDVADMFGRRARPLLEVAFRVVPGGGTSGGGHRTFRGKAIVSLVNAGRVSARAPYLSVRSTSGHNVEYFGIDGNGNEGLPRQVSTDAGDPTVFAGSTIDVIHPGTSRDILAFRVHAEITPIHGLVPPQALALELGVAAEGMPLQTRSYSVSQSTIAQAILPADVLGSGAR